MIVVRVELWSAVTGEITELARMHVSNVGGTMQRREYFAETFRGRSEKDLDKRNRQRWSGIGNWPSDRLHVWNLVTALLVRMGYGDVR